MRTKNVAAVAETTMPTMAASLRLFDLQTKQLLTHEHTASDKAVDSVHTNPQALGLAAHPLGSGYTVTYCLTSPFASRCKQATTNSSCRAFQALPQRNRTLAAG